MKRTEVVAASEDIREMLARGGKPALVVRAAMANAIALCKSVRRYPYTRTAPAILVTDRSDGLPGFSRGGSGASDFISQSFEVDDLLALIVRALHAKEQLTLNAGDVLLDLERHYAIRGGRQVQLRPVQFRLLQLFMERPHELFSWRRIVSCVWGHDPSTKKVSFQRALAQLRQALSCEGLPSIIHGYQAGGFSFVRPVDPTAPEHQAIDIPK